MATLRADKRENLLNSFYLSVIESALVGDSWRLSRGSTNFGIVANSAHSLNSRLGEWIVGHTTRIQDLSRLYHGVSTHEGSNNELFRVFLLNINEQLCYGLRLGLGLGSNKNKSTMDIRILEANISSIGIALRRGITNDINWVLD